MRLVACSTFSSQRITGCAAEWLEYGSALGSGGDPEVVVVDPPVLEDLEWLFEGDAWWTKDVGAAKPELQKVWRLSSVKLSAIQVTFLTDAWGF